MPIISIGFPSRSASIIRGRALTSFFSTRSSSGQQVITQTVRTFKALATLAEFDGESDAANDDEAPAAHINGAHSKHKASHAKANPGPNLHIDVQIHISSDSTADQIDQIFASMAKHLYKHDG